MTVPTLHVAAGILWRGPRFLAACRPAGKPRAGFWEFPGGKFEPGESAEKALTRELREELAVEVRGTSLWRTVRHEYPELIVELFFMHVTEFDGEPFPHDGQELRWVTPQEAQKLTFLPADIAIVRDLQCPHD